MADDFEAQWNQVLNDLTKHLILTSNEKALATGAGAEVYKKELHDDTPYNPRHKNGSPHLRDSIHYEIGKRYNGEKSLDGSTDVGFTKGEKTTVAYIVNNGSRKMSPKEINNMHFMERAVEKSKEAVMAAEAGVLKAIIQGGGKHDGSSKSNGSRGKGSK